MFSLEFSAWKPLWTLLIALFSIPAIYLSWRSTYAVSGSGKSRAVLLLLRIAAILVIVFMSTQAVLLISRAEKLPPKLLILADASPSMLAEGALPTFESSLRTEIDIIRKNSPDAAITMGFFSADTVVDSFAGLTVQTLTKSDGSTRIDGLLDRERADAVIVFTDGRIQDKLRWRFRQKLPLFNKGLLSPPTIYPVSSRSGKNRYDLEIKEVNADDFAYVKSRFEIKVIVRATVPQTVTVPVRVHSGGELLATADVLLKKGFSENTVSLAITPDRAGLKVCAVTVPFMEYEHVRANNSASFAFKAVRDRIRVMHIAGRPSWDLRFLRSALKRDPGVDLVSFYIMRTGSDIVNVPNEELSLIEFPYNDLFNKDLNSFDAVIFQNFSSRQFFQDMYLDNIAKYVQKGGAFLMLGGDLAYTEGGYYKTAVDDMLPFSLVPQPATNQQRKFSLRHTAAGLIHPITENLIELSKVPVEGYNGIGPLKKNAITLLETDKGEPYLTLCEYGKGRTAAVAGDGLWGLNFSGVDAGYGNRAYLETVRRLIRWLVKDPSVNELEITDLPAGIRHGENWGLKLKRTGGRKSSVELKLSDGNGKVYFRKSITPFEGSTESIMMPLLKPGVYLITAGSDAQFLEVLPSAEYTVEDSDQDFLKALADESSGKLIEDISQPGWSNKVSIERARNRKITDVSVIQLWNHPLLICLFGLLLGAEWLIRRRRGLL